MRVVRGATVKTFVVKLDAETEEMLRALERSLPGVRGRTSMVVLQLIRDEHKRERDIVADEARLKLGRPAVGVTPTKTVASARLDAETERMIKQIKMRSGVKSTSVLVRWLIRDEFKRQRNR